MSSKSAAVNAAVSSAELLSLSLLKPLKDANTHTHTHPHTHTRAGQTHAQITVLHLIPISKKLIFTLNPFTVMSVKAALKKSPISAVTVWIRVK